VVVVCVLLSSIKRGGHHQRIKATEGSSPRSPSMREHDVILGCIDLGKGCIVKEEEKAPRRREIVVSSNKAQQLAPKIKAKIEWKIKHQLDQGD
jgi:hypothetical protein